MRKYQLFIAVLGLVLLACLSSVEGQYTPPPAEVIGQPESTEIIGYPPESQIASVPQASQYAQYYTMGPAPNTHITAPQPFIMENNTPTAVYFGYQQQPIAFSQYQSNPTYNKGDTLWIKGSDSWSQHTQVPLGALVTLLAMSPNGGSGYISDTHPNGRTYTFNYFFYPASQFTFYADTPGRHTLNFGISGDPSPPVTIDVMGSYTPRRFYNPPIYPPIYYGYPFFDGLGLGGFIGEDGEFGEGFREGREEFRGGEGFVGGDEGRGGGEGGRR